ncbi:MAG: YigZ family protein [Ureaplasma sp.]|nr:YigZ family protein [Ureaplasma sp.]
MNYKQIREENKKELIVNKSKFISIAYKISSFNQLNTILNNVKQEFDSATHICYAYKLIEQNQIKEGYFESKEPKNTSGKQIYNLIESRNLLNILIIVVRYYGGTKLGIGLLSRSYLNSAKLVIEENNIIDWVNTNNYLISIDISEFDKFIYFLNKRNIQINKKDFNNTYVEININLSDDQLKLDFLQKYINL